jgi:hypothetical protein
MSVRLSRQRQSRQTREGGEPFLELDLFGVRPRLGGDELLEVADSVVRRALYSDYNIAPVDKQCGSDKRGRKWRGGRDRDETNLSFRVGRLQ